jgi:RNase P protein component
MVREFFRQNKAGFTNIDIIVIAKKNSVKYMHQDAKLLFNDLEHIQRQINKEQQK